jgi:ankyrin repeat protein
MTWRRTLGLTLVASSLATAAAAAESAALADAAEHRDWAGVRTLLQRNAADVNAGQVDGTTALHWAVYHDDVEAVRLLVRARANANAVNGYGVPPLALASTNGNAAIVALLLEAGADANAAMKGAETPLMLAARSGSADTVKALLAHGASVDARERHGQTALMWAAAEGHTAVVRALIAAGADLTAMDDSWLTPFFFAVRQGHLETVRAFLAAGIDVNATISNSRANATVTPLGLAVQNGHFELALALVDAGADPNDMRTGFAPLHLIPWVRRPDNSDISDPAPAVGAGHLSSLQFVRELVKRGANVNVRAPESAPKQPNTSSKVETPGATPFLFAADRSDVPLMRALLELGADPLLANFNHTTPLMAAAGVGTGEPEEEAGVESEALEAVTMLLDLGADVNAVNDDGETVMHGAAHNIYPQVLNLLAKRGADPKVWSRPNKYGRTPLFIAEGLVNPGGVPRPDAPTLEAVTKLMLAAGLSLEGKRPEFVDRYSTPPKK